jgi:RNA polymerase sigma factor (sigma-70 family)
MKTNKENNKSTDNAQDVLVIQEVLAGNKNAFTKIYNKYFGHIFRKISMSLNYDNTTAEDLAMETMAKIYSNLDKYQETGTFNSWVSKVAQNTLLDYLRAEKDRKNVYSYDNQVSTEDNEKTLVFQLTTLSTLISAHSKKSLMP